ncbi:HTH_48 domain-containing protein [Trichonephila clavipes]|uniref:HTH_48 domain-containing protein n=1 Tax=Trichonephila clavipes TaxID=2585209 RepID=A0A8X6WKE4_TRICX|nr:HTH_48 domain-containing protein [Trichonephila clavipes]
MQQSIEQRYAIKFCVRLGKSGASTLEMTQQAYGGESLSQAQVFRWHKMFKEGRKSVEDEPVQVARQHQEPQKTNNVTVLSTRNLCPEGQTVNGAFNVEVLKRLQRRANRVRPEFSANWKLHHDNAPSHTCIVVTEHLTKNLIVTIPQHPYNPNLAPADFFLISKGKTVLKERHHGNLDAVKRACTHALKNVSVGDFQGAYEAWKRRLQKCVHAQGAYFEDY